LTKLFILNNRRHVITEDEIGRISLWDILFCRKEGDFSGEDFQSVIERENTIEWVANWCSVELKNGVRNLNAFKSIKIFRIVYHFLKNQREKKKKKKNNRKKKYSTDQLIILCPLFLF